MKRILHIAPLNTAGVPYAFVKAERRLGYDSRLITLGKSRFGYEEDICLNLPFLRTPGIKLLRKAVSDPSRSIVENVHHIPAEIPRKWMPRGFLESTLFQFRERVWAPRIRDVLSEIDIWNVDIVQLDGGLEFYRDGRTIKELDRLGKKIICCYTGSDLRVRGVIPEIDELAHLNVTVEYDHKYFHPNIHHVFFPFDMEPFDVIPPRAQHSVRIGHAPTNRRAKGSDQIISQLKELKKSRDIEIVLIENLPYKEALKLKATCDIFVDQIGDLGYGINSLEALAMGIPVATSLVSDFGESYPDNPFIEVDKDSLVAQLQPFLDDADLRREEGIKGRDWVMKYHDHVKVVRRIHKLAGISVAETPYQENKT